MACAAGSAARIKPTCTSQPQRVWVSTFTAARGRRNVVLTHKAINGGQTIANCHIVP
jgi:hypothetical protein